MYGSRHVLGLMTGLPSECADGLLTSNEGLINIYNDHVVYFSLYLEIEFLKMFLK